jgi:ribosome maturation factor RimP
MTNIATTLSKRLAPLMQNMGYELLGCEYHSQGRHSVLRVYIENETGITVADCSRVSEQLSAVLDVEDPIRGHYSLEVSSPGIDRPLFELAHYQKQIGQCLKVRTCKPIQNQRNFTGVLLRIESDNIYLLVDKEEKIVPFSDIEKANVVGSADVRPRSIQ